MTRVTIFLFLSAALAWSPAQGEVVPSPGTGDPHIQSVEFDPNEVVALYASPGTALTVQFLPDEQIETVILGDNNSWTTQTSGRADLLVVQSKGMASNTNMTVITGQRTYNFKLYGGNDPQGISPFLVTFRYRPDKLEPDDRTSVTSIYKMSGNKLIRPLDIRDDGTSTSIKFPPNAPIPAVYFKYGQNELGLVNGTMRDGAFVIDAVYDRLIFLHGRMQASAVRRIARK